MHLVVGARLLGVSVVAAVLIAAMFLAVVVLPYAHGVDPVGVGRVLGTLQDEPAPAVPVDFERVLLVGESRAFESAFDVPAGYRVHLAWNATAPVTATLTLEPPTPVDGNPAPWPENSTSGDTSFAVPVDARATAHWVNPGSEPATITMSVRFEAL